MTTVLIVDDHPSFRVQARRSLEDGGFEVIGEAQDGATALEAAEVLEGFRDHRFLEPATWSSPLTDRRRLFRGKRDRRLRTGCPAIRQVVRCAAATT
jgi:CheY-like chemotaxis protein